MWPQIRRYVPTTITTVRLFAVVYLSLLLGPQFAFWYMTVALATSFSDWLDGYLAKRWGCTSTLGAQLDIYADKVLCWAMGAHAVINNQFSAWFWIPLATIAIYDVVVIIMRVTRNLLFTPSNIAKAKTFVEMTALVCVFVPAGLAQAAGLIGYAPNLEWIRVLSLVGLWAAGAGTVWSGLHYLELVPDIPAFWARAYWRSVKGRFLWRLGMNIWGGRI